MGKIFIPVVLLLIAFSAISCCNSQSQSGISEKPYSFGWLGYLRNESHDKYLKKAEELGFNAIAAPGFKPERLNALIKDAARADIDIYAVIYPTAPIENKKNYLQVMSEKEEKLAKMMTKEYREKHHFQFGGEPVNGNEEVLHGRRVPCFHRKEVVEETKRKVKEFIEACPGLAGIAFDKFGYHNYKCCYCDESKRQLKTFRKKNPSLSLKEAKIQFSRKSLVDFYNEIADYARELKSGIKTATHIWPVFLPEPLYGNRLDIDYCHQTVAWFFKPYWSDEKIINYTRKTVNEDNKYYPRQKGMPFFGFIWNKRNGASKNAKLFKHELDLIFSATPSKRIAVAGLKFVVNSPEHLKAMEEVFTKHGIIKDTSK